MNGKIKSIAFGGDGVCKENGKTVFVPYTIPGETVSYTLKKEKTSHAFATLNTVITPSKKRISPKCPHFGTCKGCQLQHMPYEMQLEIKEQFLRDAMLRIAKISVPINPIIASLSPFEYRKHIRMNLAVENGVFQMGYIAENKLCKIDSCSIFSSNVELFASIRALLREINPDGIKGASLRIFNPKEPYLAFSFSPRIPTHSFSNHKNFNGISMKSPSGSVTYGEKNLSYQINGIKVVCSPFGFLQNQLSLAERLYTDILSFIPSNTKMVYDLYCGIGVLSLMLARKGIETIGIDASKANIERAKKNAQINDAKPKYVQRSVEQCSLKGAEVVIINPPREGISKEVLAHLLEVKPGLLLYVSCMPSTLARDLAQFVNTGYTVASCTPYDMFPQTTHLETLAVLHTNPTYKGAPSIVNKT